MAKFNERLKLLRRESGLSQQDFAKQLGTSKSSVNMYERGEREPGIETLEAILITSMLIWIIYLVNRIIEVNRHG